MKNLNLERQSVPLFGALIAVAASLISASSFAQAPTDGLLLHHRYNDGTGTTVADSSGNSLQGQINGAAWVGGFAGTALNFDGTDSVQVSSTQLNQVSNAVTLSAWVYLNSTPSNWASVASRQLGSTNDEHYFFGLNGLSARFCVSTSTGGSDCSQGANLSVGNWHHLVGTYDGSDTRMYLDGTQVFTDAHSGTFSSDSTPLVVGGNINSAAGPIQENFPGIIDNLRIYTRAVTVAEVPLLASEDNVDTQAPSVPTGVSASATSATQVSLSWSAATDNVGVTGYLVERCQGASCSNFVQIATTAVASFNDTALAAATVYRYRIRAQDAANNPSSYSLIISATTAAAPDAQAPTVPTQLIATPGVNQIVYSWDPSADKHDGTNAGTGVGAYILNIDGVDQPAITSGVNSNVVERCTLLETGTTGSSFTQAGNDDTFVSTNSSIEMTDAFPFCYWTVTGDFTLTTTVQSMSSAGTVASYAFAGIMARATDTPSNTARYLAFGQYLSANNRGLQQVQRLTAAGGYSYFGSVPGTNSAARVQIARVGNVFTYNYSLDGINWLSLGSDTQALPTTLRVGAFSSSYGTGTLTAVFRDLKYTQDLRLSHTHSVVYPATVVAKLRARDAATSQNLSAYTATVTASPLADTQAPSAPTGVSASATSATQVSLSWSAATDNVGVTGYRVERCQGASCSNFVQLATTAVASFNDTALAAATVYRYRIRAQDAANNPGSYSSIVSATTAAPPDSLAPTVPTRLIATPGENQIVYSWDPSTDKHDGTNAGTGVGAYILNIDGVDQPAITSGVSANGVARPTCIETGTTGSTFTQSGNDDMFVSTNTQLDITDAFPFCYWSVTGDFTLTTQVQSMSSSGTVPVYAFAGIMARVASDTPDNQERYLAFGQYLSHNSRGLQQVQRLTAGGSYSYFGAATGVGSAAYVQISRVGNVFTYNYSYDGEEWLTLGSDTQALPTTLRVGAFSSSYGTGTLTAVFRDLTYTQSARLSYTYNVTYPATVVAKVRARDSVGASNTSAYSATVTASPLDAPPAENATKYKAGLWPQLNLLVPKVTDTAGWADLQAQFDAAAALPGVVGIQLITTWGVLENSNRGNYSDGDAVIDKIISDLAVPNGKPVYIHIWPRRFGTNGSLPSTPQTSSTRAWPDYLLTGGHVAAEGYAQSAKLWDATVNGYYIDLWAHLGTRYNSSKWIHGFETEETADLEEWSGYSYSGRVAQWYRFLDEIKPYFPNTGIRINVNFFSTFDAAGVAATRDFVEAIYDHGYGIGGPDMYTHRSGGAKPTVGECVVRGLGAITDWYGLDIDCGTKDYRGLMSIAYHHEFINNNTRAVLFNYSKNEIKNTHLVWSVSPPAAGPPYDCEAAFGLGYDQDCNPILPTEAFHGSDGFYNYYMDQPTPRTDDTCPENLNGTCSPDWGSAIWEPVRFFDVAIDVVNCAVIDWRVVA